MSRSVERYDVEQVSRRIWHSRKIGMNWDDIRDDVNVTYNLDLTAQRIAMLYRERMVHLSTNYGAEDTIQELGMELERLNDLQNAHWAEAVSGDINSTKMVLDVMKQRHRLLGLDQLNAADALVQQTVLVIGQNKDEWVEALSHGKNRGVIMPVPPRDDSDMEDGT